jgi:biotin carboxylase
MKRLMLLVSALSYRSAAFCEAAKRLEVEVIQALDLPKELAEYWHVELGVPFADPDQAVEDIIRYAETQPIHAIVPVDDAATLLAARAAERLGLAWNSPEASLAARDKYHMRTRFAAAGVPSPSFRLASFDEDPEALSQEVPYPCVIKPRRMSGSRGVIRADDPAGFVAAFRRVQRLVQAEGGMEVLVEDFIPGFEVALEGLLTDGRLQVLALFDKPDPLDGPFFEETIYVSPSRLAAESQQAIARCAEAAARSVGLRQGPVHAELRLNDSGPWMVELAGRSIGGLCSSILEFGAGMSLEELILRHALHLELPDVSRTGGAVGVMMIPIPAGGRLEEVHGTDEARAVPLVQDVVISVRPGQRVVPLPEGASYLGFIFAKGPTPDDVEAALRTAHHRLRFDIRPELPIVGSGVRIQNVGTPSPRPSTEA